MSNQKYKYIYFEFAERKPKTGVWNCRANSSGALIGIVKWYPPWRQYCFFPGPASLYSVSCLDDIEDFISKISSPDFVLPEVTP